MWLVSYKQTVLAACRKLCPYCGESSVLCFSGNKGSKVFLKVCSFCNVKMGLCFNCRQLIYNYPEQLFGAAGIMAIEHADFAGVERLALVTGLWSTLLGAAWRVTLFIWPLVNASS